MGEAAVLGWRIWQRHLDGPASRQHTVLSANLPRCPVSSSPPPTTLCNTGCRPLVRVRLASTQDLIEGLFRAMTMSLVRIVFQMQDGKLLMYNHHPLRSYPFPQELSAPFNFFNIYNSDCKMLHRHAAVVGSGFSPGPLAFLPQCKHSHIGWQLHMAL